MIDSDLRYAIRGLARRPALAVVTILALTIGISANAIMFGVVDQLMLRPPALIKDPDHVRRVFFREHRDGKLQGMSTTPYRLMAALRPTPALSDVAVFSGASFTMGRGADAQMVSGMAVTANYFRTLGVQPALGRAFLPEEDRPPQGPLVAILGDGFWHRVFGGANDITGKTVTLDGKAFTIVGVMPPKFTGVDRFSVDLWIPMSAVSVERISKDWATTPNSYWTQGVARVRPSETIARAEREATTIYRNEIKGWNQPWRDSTGSVALASLAAGATETGFSAEAKVAGWLLGVSAMVLLIACANVANLLIARTVERRREIAVRLALGASRGRLLRQLLVEASVLAALAAAAALVVARLGGRVVERMLLPGIAWDGSVVDRRMLLFTLAIAVLCILLAGFAPAMQAARTSVNDGLKSSSRQIAGGTGRARMIFLVLQVSLSLVLLVGAGLFVRSLRHVVHRDVGVDIDRVALVMPVRRREASDEEVGEWYRQAYNRAASLPGVERAALVASTVPGRMSSAFNISVPGQAQSEFPGGGPYETISGNDYLAAMGTKIIRGRSFTPEEERGPSRVMLVNRIVADKFWPGQNPIGQCVTVHDEKSCTKVVGVVENMMMFKLVNDDRASIYLPWTHPAVKGALASAMVVRAHGDAEGLIKPLQLALQGISDAAAFVTPAPYTQIVEPEMRSWRLGATMFSIFGMLATIIAGVGLYSVMAYWASQRTHEMGVRMALGAQRQDVVRLLGAHALRAVGIGLVVGTIVAFALSRWVADLLYDTSPREPSAYLLAALTLGIAALFAAAVPARRVARVDPAEALRSE